MVRSRGASAVRLAVLLVAFALAGCLSPAATPQGASPAPRSDDAMPLAALGLAGTSCVEGGGHSVHPVSLNPLPLPWMPADILDDVGDQLLYSEVPDPENPIPTKGKTMGNYHATMWCDAWSLDGEPRDDLFMGFVGMKVEPPAFDPDAAAPTHSYLVTVIATNDDEVLARLQAAGFNATMATATREALPDGTLRIQMMTEGNGDYDSIFTPKEIGPNDATFIRLWWQQGYNGHDAHAEHAEHGMGFVPIALDLARAGGMHDVAAANGYFSHSGTDHHAPLPGAYGHTAALMYTGFDAAFSWGPRPNVTLSDAYVH